VKSRAFPSALADAMPVILVTDDQRRDREMKKK
jgi:hypothetical protein